jgi:hypothetical protein
VIRGPTPLGHAAPSLVTVCPPRAAIRKKYYGSLTRPARNGYIPARTRLIDASAGIMRRQGVRVEAIRAADHDIATGVWPDMTEHGAADLARR